MTEEQKEIIKNDIMIGKEISLLKEEKKAYAEELKREQSRFAAQLKRGMGEKMLEGIKPKSKIKLFFKKLFSIYG
jgi:hypothetical protein